MKKKMRDSLFCLLAAVFAVSCGQPAEDSNTWEQQTASVQEEIAAEEPVAEPQDAEEDKAEEAEAVEEENIPDFMPGYATFDAWRERHLGSVGLIGDKTLLVSIYLNEPESRWDEADIDYTRQIMDIGYGYLYEQMLQYGVNMELIYDSREYTDLFYELDIEEEIPAYVTTEKERELDAEVDKWLTNIPVQELMQKYEADSIGFLFFIDHEGCSYSSMHFIDDGIETWDECCMLYLKDMYSKTLEYETPAVYAHELLHLFGAEDLYKAAEVFSSETYAYAMKEYPNDIMINTFENINGKYTIYPDKVVQVISPITAYLVGAVSDEAVREACPELLKEEMGCFSGSAYDRPF